MTEDKDKITKMRKIIKTKSFLMHLSNLMNEISAIYLILFSKGFGHERSSCHLIKSSIFENSLILDMV